MRDKFTEGGHAIGPEEDAIGIFEKELSGSVGLPPQLGHPCCNLDVHVRVAIEPLAHQSQFFRRTCHVGTQKRGIRVAPDDAVAGLEQFALGREVPAVEGESV